MANNTIFTIAFVCIIAIIFGTINSKNGNMQIASAENAETMQGKEEQNYLKALTTVTARMPNTNNFTYVESLDGVQVPVPKGYIASSVEDEMYVNGVNGTLKLQENLTLTSPEGEKYPWMQNASTGVWSSGNYKISNSTSTIETNSFTVSENAVVRINWSVCCQANKNADYAYYTITNTGTGATIGGTQEARISGIGYGKVEASLIYIKKDVKLEAGTYKVKITYRKDGGTDLYLDKAYLKSIGVYTKSAEGSEITVREHTGGFVIYEGTETVTSSNVATAKTTRNQYVWVPISSTDVSNMYRITNGILYGNRYEFTANGYSRDTSSLYANTEPMVNGERDLDHTHLKKYLEGMSRSQFLQEMREELYKMLESVKTYEGFYIGRYETGNINQKVPVVKKGNSTISSVNWYVTYKRCKNLKGNNKAVQTGLIWRNQWDETLKWLINSGEKIYAEVGSDSSSWANYSDTKRPTGYSETWKANNIYDLAGNVADGTMEGFGADRRLAMRRGIFLQSHR